ncbi:hypothetical protein SteCoe_33523 [Stentor coeruleus]|uniref:Uncharacterized protein n=1 Tax=Stentor coeruleus TaxID=5963 RepID=A0A1R2AWK2_9CILI|nr:hypothetical protein SteCoe_33523 [Stentor coeruleus]
MKDTETNIKGACRLPCLKIYTARSTSARLHIDPNLQDSITEDATPYFKHNRGQSNSIENSFMEHDISILCNRIIKEQNILKQKIIQQEKIIKSICRQRPLVYRIDYGNIPQQKENKEITFKPDMWPQSAKAHKRFIFPRDVFTRKVPTRQC